MTIWHLRWTKACPNQINIPLKRDRWLDWTSLTWKCQESKASNSNRQFSPKHSIIRSLNTADHQNPTKSSAPKTTHAITILTPRDCFISVGQCESKLCSPTGSSTKPRHFVLTFNPTHTFHLNQVQESPTYTISLRLLLYSSPAVTTAIAVVVEAPAAAVYQGMLLSRLPYGLGHCPLFNSIRGGLSSSIFPCCDCTCLCVVPCSRNHANACVVLDFADTQSLVVYRIL